MSTPLPTYTIFVLLRALPAWLRLARPRRNEIATAALTDALKVGAVALRHFDAEGFTGFCSDVALFETEDLMAFYFVMERLRDSALLAEPYFEVIQIIPAIADGFRRFEQSAA